MARLRCVTQVTPGKGKLPPDAPPRVVSDVRAVALLALMATFCLAPNFSWRLGAVACAVLGVLSLRGWKPTAMDLAAVAFAVLTWASSVWTVAADFTRVDAWNISAAVATFLAVRIATRNRRAWFAAALGLVVGCLSLVYRVYTDNNIDTVRFSLSDSTGRATLDGINANYIAYILATGMILVVILLASVHSPSRWLLPAGGVVLVLYAGAVQVGTRGAVLGAGMAAIWALWNLLSKPRSDRRLTLLLASVSVAAVAIVAGWFERVARVFVGASPRDTGDLNGRFVLWPAAAHWWNQHLFIGGGSGSFRSVSPLGGVAAHNVILDVGSGLGLVGVAVYVWLLYSVVRATRRASSRVLVVGVAVAATAPLLLSGYWYQSPVLWATLALVTTYPLHAESAGRTSTRGTAAAAMVQVHREGRHPGGNVAAQHRGRGRRRLRDEFVRPSVRAQGRGAVKGERREPVPALGTTCTGRAWSLGVAAGQGFGRGDSGALIGSLGACRGSSGR